MRTKQTKSLEKICKLMRDFKVIFKSFIDADDTEGDLQACMVK